MSRKRYELVEAKDQGMGCCGFFTLATFLLLAVVGAWILMHGHA